MSLVLCDVSHHVATLTLNRPDKRNALSRELLLALIAAAQTADRDPQVRVIRLQGAGDHFCAGADIDWMRSSLHASAQQNRDDAALIARAMAALNTLAKPLVACVHGAAIGAGVGLTAVADVALASDDARFGLGEVKLGIIPSVIAPYVVAKVGESQSRRYFVTGERISAAHAREIGLVHEVVTRNELDRRTQAIVAAMLEGGPKALVAAKKMVKDLSGGYAPDVLERTIDTIAQIRLTPEAQEGLTAFLEKRQPSWID